MTATPVQHGRARPGAGHRDARELRRWDLRRRSGQQGAVQPHSRRDGFRDRGRVLCRMRDPGNDLVGVPAGIAVGSGVASLGAAGNVIESNVITGGSTTTWGVISIPAQRIASGVETIVRGNIVRDVGIGHAIWVNGAEQVSLVDNLIRISGPPTRATASSFRTARTSASLAARSRAREVSDSASAAPTSVSATCASPMRPVPATSPRGSAWTCWERPARRSA